MTALTLDRPPVIGGRLGDVPLSALTDAELLEMYSADGASDALRADVLLVMDARDRDAKRERANRDRRRNDPVTAEWRDYAHEQYLAAERDLRGHLVRHGSPVTDAFQLWQGSQAFAERNATADLIEWWQAHPRITVTAYRAQRQAALRGQRDDYESEAYDDGGLAEHEPWPVRRGAGSDRAGDAGRGSGDAVSRDDAPAEGPDTRAARRAASLAAVAAGPAGDAPAGPELTREQRAADRRARMAEVLAGVEERRARYGRYATDGSAGAVARPAAPGPAPASTQPLSAALAAIQADPSLAPIHDQLARFAAWPGDGLTVATLWTRAASLATTD
jgi:hypothetical protein